MRLRILLILIIPSIFIVKPSVGQTNNILNTGSYTFSNLYTFGLISKERSKYGEEVIQRDHNGLIIAKYHVDITGKDTSYLQRFGYSYDGLPKYYYSINNQGDTTYYFKKWYNQNNDLVRETENSDFTKTYEYNYDSSFYLQYKEGTAYNVLIAKVYFDKEKRKRQELLFDCGNYAGKNIYAYPDSSDLTEVKIFNSLGERSGTKKMNKEGHTVYEDIQYPDGRKRIIVEQKMEAQQKKVLQFTKNETANIDQLSYTHSTQEKYANGLTKRLNLVSAYSMDFESNIEIEYALTKDSLYKERRASQRVYKSEFDQYILIDILTNDTTIVGEPSEDLEAYEADLYDTKSSSERSDLEETIYNKKPITVYTIGKPEVLVISGKYSNTEYYKSIFGYTNFHYNSKKQLVLEEVIWGEAKTVVYKYDSTGNIIFKRRDDKIEQYSFENNGLLSMKTEYNEQTDDADTLKYDINGNITYRSGGSREYEFENTLRIRTLGDGLAHKHSITLTEKGMYTFDIIGKNGQFNFQILDHKGTPILPKKGQHTFDLKEGQYSLITAASTETANDVYTLGITRAER